MILGRRPSLLALVILFGCSGEPALLPSAPASALRQRFPDQAARVLEQGEAFLGSEEGFVLRTPGVWRGVEVALPRDGREAIRFRGFGGGEVQVREIGAEGEGAPAEHAVAYRREGGTSFWTSAAGGVEEWLLLEAGAVRGGEAAVTWELEGATARQQGEEVEVVDAGGVVQLSVTAPKAYATGGREVVARLRASGARMELQVDAGGEAVLVDPQWVSVASMSQARAEHTATLLASGKVLVAGGDGPLASAELYDPATNLWSATSAMNQSRAQHAATLLASGDVLVAGGNLSKSAEVYTPGSNTWLLTASMGEYRFRGTVTLLGSGKVLAAGGTSGPMAKASAELYDPATNTWSPTGPMSWARWGHTATLLGSGKVLVTGGMDWAIQSILDTAELYNPVTNTWSAAASMNGARVDHTATLLGSGKVLVAGGQYGVNGDPSAELYDPATDTWSAASPMSTGRSRHTATLLGSGKVLVAAGFSNSTLASAELYDPVTDTWSATAPLNTGRGEHTATLLGSNEVLVTGGYNNGILTSAEVYDPAPGLLGSLCGSAADCQSGFCTDGVCCDTACNAGACDACSIAAGAAVNGTCALLTGTPCNDGSSCTQADTCQAGVCIGSNPVICPMPDQCHTPGLCNPATGICSTPAKADGTVCSDGNGCTQTDTCQVGVCVGNNPVACPMPDQCHAQGLCKPATGICSTPAKADGAACDDGNGCTQTDTCQAGVCTGMSPVACPAPDACHDAGTCDAMTGMCGSPVNKPDNSPCPGGVCMAGNCVPQGSSSASSGGGASSSGGGASSSGSSGGASGSSGSGGGASGSGASGSGGGASSSGGGESGSSSGGGSSESGSTGSGSGGSGSSGGSTQEGGCGCRFASSPTPGERPMARPRPPALAQAAPAPRTSANLGPTR